MNIEWKWILEFPLLLSISIYSLHEAIFLCVRRVNHIQFLTSWNNSQPDRNSKYHEQYSRLPILNVQYRAMRCNVCSEWCDIVLWDENVILCLNMMCTLFHLGAFDDYLDIQQTNVVDASVAQIMARFCYSIFGKAKTWFNQSRDGTPHAKVADSEALKEQFKQQFNPVGNTRKEQMVGWRNNKWDGNKTVDEFSYRATQLSRAPGLNNQHIQDTFKLGLPSKCLCKCGSHRWHASTIEDDQSLWLYQREHCQVHMLQPLSHMAALSLDGMTSGMYQKPDMLKQLAFSDSSLLSGLQKINKKPEM